jgi:hypothetical protein
MKFVKRLKAAGIATLTAIGVLTLAACSPALKNAQSLLNEKMEDKINTAETMENLGVSKIEKYVFLGADFDKLGDKYSLEINGIAKYDDGKKGYVNAGLTIDQSKLENINDKTDKVEVLNVITDCLNEYDFEYLEVLPVEHIKNFSNAITKSIDSPIDNFNYSKGMVYGLSKPVMNYEEGYAVFQAKSYVKFYRTEIKTTYGFQGTDSNGKAKYGPIVVTRTYYEDYSHKNNFYIKASQKELKEMEANPELAYSKFVEMFNAKDKSKYTVQSVEVEKSKEIDTNMLEDTSLELDR